MHVTIITDTGLPDVRVEKEIMTLLKNHYEVTIIGTVRDTTGIIDHELLKRIRVIDLNWRREVRLKIEPYYSWFKRKVKRILETVKPDIVLAINIFAGIIVHELGYPMLLDDHELYSLELKASKSFGLKKIIRKYKLMLFKRMEETIAQDHPVMVVSNEMKKYYVNVYGARESKVKVMKNYPSKKEIKQLTFKEIDCERMIFTYIGKELTNNVEKTYRNMNDTARILCKLGKKFPNKIRVLLIGDNNKLCEIMQPYGYIKHMDMYKYIVSSHYGLLTWAPSWFHKYCNPNKPYIYAVSGSLPIVTSDLVEVISDFKNNEIIVINANNFKKELGSTLTNLIINKDCDYINKMRRKLKEYSIQHLLWESQEEKILKLLKIA